MFFAQVWNALDYHQRRHVPKFESVSKHLAPPRGDERSLSVTTTILDKCMYFNSAWTKFDTVAGPVEVCGRVGTDVYVFES